MEVRIDGWRKGIRFSSAHATLDLGKCERLHGHSYALHCNILGGQEERRIVMDFVEVIRALKQIADELDHFVIVPTKSPRMKVKVEGDTVRMDNGAKHYEFPRGDCFLLPRPSSTAEDLSSFILERFLQLVKPPPSVERIQVGCDEGYGQGAWSEWTAKKKGAKK